MKQFITVILVLLFFSAMGQEPSFVQDCVKIVRIKSKDGSESIYATINSKKQGYRIDYDSLGRRKMEVCYVDGKQTGPFIIYYPNGNINLKASSRDNHPDGQSWCYDSNGILRSMTTFKMGNRHGITEQYIEDGRLDKRLLFRNDTLVRILEDHHYYPLPPLMEPLEKD